MALLEVDFFASTTGTLCLLSGCSRTAYRFRAEDLHLLPEVPGRQRKFDPSSSRRSSAR
jgi:hypothetical protein